ncbi:MAG: SRPBCC family protein [Phycisphaerales bacterium]
MRERVLDVVQVVPAPLERVFAFFADAANLERLTPAFLRFAILSPRPIQMRAGALIDYSIRLYGVPMRWRSRITVWEPGVRFVDEQVKGPYSLWVHEHTFEAVRDERGREATRVRDVVRYAAPVDWLSHGLFVRPNLERIFAFRRAGIERVFPAAAG